MTTVEVSARTPALPSRRRRVALLLLAAIALWLIVGFARGPQLAAARLAALEQPERVDQVVTTTVPAIPPFFVVEVQGEVFLGERTWYSASRFYLVEPVSGWSLDLSGLGVAPAAALPGAATTSVIR